MKKHLKNMLLIGENAHEFEQLNIYDVNVDVVEQNKAYELIVYVNPIFKLNLEFPRSIADAEIWYERGEKLTVEHVLRGIEHYYNCEIRNGK